MPRYRYKAVAASGEVVEGELEGADRKEVIDRLRGQGHLPIRADEARPARAAALPGAIGRRSQRLTTRHVLLFTQELATLLAAGLPLDRSLSLVAGLDEAGPGGEMARSVLDRVRGGASFADALGAYEHVLPSYYAGMVRAGEAGGNLDAVLARLAETLERSEALQASIRHALRYPMLVLVVAGFSVVILLTAVVPEFRPLFEQAGAALPVSTRVVLALSAGFESYWWLIVLGAAALYYGVRRLRRHPAGRRWFDRWLLRSRVFGELTRNIEVVRFSRTLGTLLGNGVTMLNAVAITVGSLGNSAFADAVGGLHLRLKKGEGLAEPLHGCGVFPTLAVQLVKVGEESGQMEAMLLRIADIYDEEVRRSVERLLSLLVPVVTFALGLLVAGIIGSILSAILSSYDVPL